MKVAVTGANGFIGRHLCPALERSGIEAVRAVRNPMPGALAIGSIDGSTDWTTALNSASAMIHLAARTHRVQRKRLAGSRQYPLKKA